MPQLSIFDGNAAQRQISTKQRRRCVIYATSRRTVLCGAGAIAGAAFSTAAPGALHRPALARVIVDNDFAGDPDGLVALAHQLASRSSRCVLITTSTLDRGLASRGGLDPRSTAAQGAEFARELMACMGAPARHARSWPAVSIPVPPGFRRRHGRLSRKPCAMIPCRCSSPAAAH